MILKHDEQSVLLAIAGNCESLDGIPQMRIDSIVSRLRVNGMIDANGDPTKRGLHVASKLTSTKQETALDGGIQRLAEPNLDGQIDGRDSSEDQGDALDLADESGSRPNAEAEERPSDACVGDLSDLSKPD